MCWAYKWQHWAQWLSSFRLYLSSPLWTLSVIPDPFLSNYSTLFYLPVTLSMSYLVSLSSLVLKSKCSTKRGLPFKMRLYVIICLSFSICKVVKYHMKKYRNGKFWKQMWIYFLTFNIQPNLDTRLKRIMTAVLINPKDKQKYIFLPSYTWKISGGRWSGHPWECLVQYDTNKAKEFF